ncbi:Non-repetitive/WGA-negative nucleoporin C-terminal-domain-containing protein [Mrakia frigida]|uniref:Nup133p n=1 Tax=Mrakia frigida TaxID=29902 RepID=UPI003FCC2595
MFSSTTGTPRRRPARKAGVPGSPSPAAPSSFNGALSPSTSSPSSPLSFNQSLQPPPTQQRASSSLRVVQYAGSVEGGDEQMDGGASDFGAATTQTRGDGRDSKVWVRDARHEVFEQGGLPAEVEEVLKSADLYTTALAGSLDATSGFATLITHSYLFVWNYLKKSYSSSPTLYAFPVPATSALCHSQLVRHPGGREPGVLVVSPQGEVRFWEGVSQALVGGGERFVSGEVSGLGDDEEVMDIKEVEPGLYILTTSFSHLHLLTLSHPSGRTTVSTTPFPRSSSSSSGLLSRFFRSSPSTPSTPSASSSTQHSSSDHPPISIALAPLSQEIFVLTTPNLQRWRLASNSRTPFLVSEHNILEGISSLLGGGESGESGLDVSLELHGVEVMDEEKGQIAVLVSYVDERRWKAGFGDERGGKVGEERSFAVGIVRFGGSGEMEVGRLIGCEFKMNIDPRPLPLPSFIIPPSSNTAFIILPSSILVLSLSSAEAPYEEAITLKDQARNAFLGIGLSSTPTTSDRTEVAVITKESGVLSVGVKLKGALEDAGDRASTATARLKSKIEQAIFYGDRPENPLSFQLFAGYDGNLMLAAEQVSTEILSSSSPNMPAILDLRTQIGDRLNRLKGLIGFITENGLLGKLSQSSRRKISWDMEKLRACAELWTYQNARMSGEALTGTPKGLLSDGIATVMQQFGFGAGEDVVRLFFRTKPRELASVLDQVSNHLRTALEPSPSIQSTSKWLIEANRVFLTTLRASFRHREETSTKYGILRSESLLEPWTCTPSILDALEHLVSLTETIIRERSREFGSSLDEEPVQFRGAVGSGGEGSNGVVGELSAGQSVQRELKDQLCELGAALCQGFEDRLRHLSTVLNYSEGNNDREANALSERWLAVRPRVIHALVRIGRSAQAYELAENHHDFRALVELVNDPQIGSSSKTQHYIEKFKEEFAFQLYQWYIEQGKLKTLLTQDEIYGNLLLSFLDSSDNPRIAWIHDLATNRYDQASKSLLKESEQEFKLADKQLMLSISKLCQVVKISQDSNPSPESRKVLDGIDDRLDLISVHSKLRTLFQQAVASQPLQYQSNVDEAVELATRSLAPQLTEFPALRALFVKLGKDLVSGKTLQAEDLVDLLTLKANQQEDQTGDFAIALDVLSRARDIPEGRAHVALLSIWRRIFIRDDWSGLASTSNLADQQLDGILRSTALYQTHSILPDIESPTPPLTPQQAVFSSSASPAELAARFSEASADEIEALWQDVRAEDDKLKRFIEGDGRLTEWAGEVERLIKEGEESDEDELVE